MPLQYIHTRHIGQVSTTANRPAWRGASRPSCCTQISTVSMINWWPTTIHLSWQHLRRSTWQLVWLVPTKIRTVHVTYNHAPFDDGLPSVGQHLLPLTDIPNLNSLSPPSTYYEDMTCDTKCRKWGSLG